MSHEHNKVVKAINSLSILDPDHDRPVVTYRMGHTIANTHPGGRRGTFAPDDFKLGHKRLVAVMARPGVINRNIYIRLHYNVATLRGHVPLVSLLRSSLGITPHHG
jgi:hypothetical protein